MDKYILKVALNKLYTEMIGERNLLTVDLSKLDNGEYMIFNYMKKYRARYGTELNYDEECLNNLRIELRRIVSENDDVTMNVSIVRTLRIRIYSHFIQNIINELGIKMNEKIMDMCFSMVLLQSKGNRFYDGPVIKLNKFIDNHLDIELDESELKNFLTDEDINNIIEFMKRRKDGKVNEKC